jgi:tripartite-type tricarboxylate transporter receptor subunit TctC
MMRPLFSPLLAMTAMLAVVATLATPRDALAQAYPDRPIKIVVPFEPGGTTDIIGRLVADQLHSALGVSVVVENRGGSGGTIGAAYVARAPADGYTLLLATAGTSAINPNIRKVPYDPLRSFALISQVADTKVLIVVNASLGVNNLAQLVELSKTRPGGIDFASAGNGSISHLTGELFRQVTGAHLNHVPYKGAGPAMTDVLAGRVPVFMNNIPPFLALIRSGQLKPLAVAATERSEFVPDVPTTAQAGVNGVTVSGWFGIMAPAGTPEAIVKTLAEALRKMAQSPAARQRMSDAGSDVKTSASPEAFQQFVVSELAKWKNVVAQGNLQLD